MPTLLLPPRQSSGSTAIRDAALDAGWSVERLGGWQAPDHLADREDLVVYGEPLFCAVIADQLGIALLEPPLDWLAGLPEPLRRRDVRSATFSEATQLRTPAFVKPADAKAFPACVYPSGDALPPPESIGPDLRVLVAEPVTWDVEYRCFVADREVVAMSPYIRGGELAQAEDGSWPAPDTEQRAAATFAGRVLQDREVRFPPGVVLDVGHIAGRGWAVVELNPAWGSGICGCDAARVLGAVRRACAPRKSMSDSSLEWVVQR